MVLLGLSPLQGTENKIDELVSSWSCNVILSSSTFMLRKETNEGITLLSVASFMTDMYGGFVR